MFRKIIQFILILSIGFIGNIRFLSPTVLADNFVFTNVSINDIKNNKLSIDWNLNEPAHTWLKIETKDKKWQKTIYNNDYESYGQFKIALPKEKTVYHYYIIAETFDHKKTISLKYNFKIDKFINDEPLRFVKGPEVVYINNTNAVIIWQVNKKATTNLFYGTKQKLKKMSSSHFSALNNNTGKAFLNNLKPNTIYRFQVNIKDKYEKISSPIKIFKTYSQRKNSKAEITKIQTTKTDSSITVSWQTNIPANCYLKYRSNEQTYKEIKEPEWYSTYHKIKINNLKPNKKYFYKIKCIDILKQKISIEDKNITTIKPMVLGYQTEPKYFYNQPYKLVKTKNNPTVYILVKGQKYAIKSPQSFASYGFNWSDVKTINKIALAKYPIAKLFKTPNNETIYRFYPKFYKKKSFLSASAFFSYPENKLVDIITISEFDIKNIPDVTLIKEKNKNTVYLLEKKFKRPIKDIKTLRKYNLLKEPIITLSAEDLATYRTEYLLQ